MCGYNVVYNYWVYFVCFFCLCFPWLCVFFVVCCCVNVVVYILWVLYCCFLGVVIVVVRVVVFMFLVGVILLVSMCAALLVCFGCVCVFDGFRLYAFVDT